MAKYTDEQIKKALDILAKFDFFQGQRAGRELWFDKPTDIQNEDITNFSKDVAFLKDLIKRQEAEIERLKEYEEIRPVGCPNCSGGNFSNSKFCSHCGTQLQGKKKDIDREIAEYKSEIVTLKDSNKNLQELYYTEREKVKKAKQKVINIAKALQSAKSEAIKEFVERINEILCLQIGPSRRLFWKIKADIDNLVKEMAGEGE